MYCRCRITALQVNKHVVHLSTRQSSSKYRRTVNLPKSTFQLSMKDGVTSRREKEIRQTCGFAELYKWQQGQQRDQDFILHDGPPYANGDPHVGHALNKILKDVTNRYKLLRGYKVHYVPGWDCHGTPIEQKALAEIREDHASLKPLDIRSKAKDFAKKTIKTQMAAFKSWGIMADWENSVYYTFDKQYEVAQLDAFFDMYTKGFVYQQYMPVFWSPSSRTALAEGELEYNDEHRSTSVFVTFPIVKLPEGIHHALGGNNTDISAVIWTTTPWTLPLNRAICYGPGIQYSFLKCKESGRVYLLGNNFIEKFEQLISGSLESLLTVTGDKLAGSAYHHPLIKDVEKPLLPGQHVTTVKGTGLVHTAPAHGPEDFQVALNNNLSLDCFVDEEGRYTTDVSEHLQGKHVLTDGNITVLEMLKDHVIHQEEFIHSYPYDWRTKQPTILRASKQWFINTTSIRDTALSCLKEVKIHPANSGQGMQSQLMARTYWCISRQRVWGVPIPVFYHAKTCEPLITRATIEHVKELVGRHGTDCWWSLPSEQLLPKAVLQQSGVNENETYIAGSDVLDIWFDSGVSWLAVLQGKQADVYLEGLDQFGGWFQSSLLTSAALTATAPYKNLVVHGFTLDEAGKKMSKSLGNVVSPDTVINGGKDKEKQPAYGVDVLRWWAARSSLDTKVTIGPSVTKDCNEQMFKVRKCVRFLLGNLHDFHPEEHSINYNELLPLDKYMLHLLHEYICQVTEAYENFNYSKVLQLTEKFINTHVSGFHCHVTKDRLYCNTTDSVERHSAQTAKCMVLRSLAVCIAPVVPHLAEEIQQHAHFMQDTGSIFHRQWPSVDPRWNNPDLSEVFDLAFTIRDNFYQVIAAENPVEFDLAIAAKITTFSKLKTLQEQELTSSTSTLCELLQCSRVSLLSTLPVIPDEAQVSRCLHTYTGKDGVEKHNKCLLILLPAELYICDRCRRYTAKKASEPCARCTEALTHGWDR